MAYNLYCLFLFGLLAFVATRAKGGLFSHEIDCTHSWENDHCYVCGEDR